MVTDTVFLYVVTKAVYIQYGESIFPFIVTIMQYVVPVLLTKLLHPLLDSLLFKFGRICCEGNHIYHSKMVATIYCIWTVVTVIMFITSLICVYTVDRYACLFLSCYEIPTVSRAIATYPVQYLFPSVMAVFYCVELLCVWCYRQIIQNKFSLQTWSLSLILKVFKLMCIMCLSIFPVEIYPPYCINSKRFANRSTSGYHGIVATYYFIIMTIDVLLYSPIVGISSMLMIVFWSKKGQDSYEWFSGTLCILYHSWMICTLLRTKLKYYTFVVIAGLFLITASFLLLAFYDQICFRDIVDKYYDVDTNKLDFYTQTFNVYETNTDWRTTDWPDVKKNDPYIKNCMQTIDYLSHVFGFHSRKSSRYDSYFNR